ncbi:hypothetical protein RND71_011651 [Anisodus tanguticus]|uniref:ACT domain-containing protein ACR n=1 Tax=Anisodus tanguticus TaxID=243964 RepID=A0AAE1SBQ4_9SOLA|nr:hypothetical protein RND71_011651 [Anisodus tanguticus]
MVQVLTDLDLLILRSYICSDGGWLMDVFHVTGQLGNKITDESLIHYIEQHASFTVEDKLEHGPILDSYRVAQIQAQLENVVEAHRYEGERRNVRQKGRNSTEVKIGNCKEKGYSIVTVRSIDRPKLLFDTICTLTELQYIVFHASMSSFESVAVQEYYVRHKNGWTLDSESERRRMTQNLMAATERRVSHGLRLDVTTQNRVGLLSAITRVFRENGLSISRAEVGVQGEKAVGTFNVKDASGQAVNPETFFPKKGGTPTPRAPTPRSDRSVKEVNHGDSIDFKGTLEIVRQEIGGTVLNLNWELIKGEATSYNLLYCLGVVRSSLDDAEMSSLTKLEVTP